MTDQERKASLGMMDMPPQSIIDAARCVENYFRDKGYEHWQLCGIENRGCNIGRAALTILDALIKDTGADKGNGG